MEELTTVSRRWLLAALAAGTAEAAFGAPGASPRPHTRTARQPFIPSPQALIERARLDGAVSYAVASGGHWLEARGVDRPQPPASTAKTLTTLYGLDALGPSHRFQTRLLATGPLVDGQIEGDLLLAGGGDPGLDTDGLAEMAAALKAGGVHAVAGRFAVWGGALPQLGEIDPDQPPHVAYNPALGGLNLNYNRVHFSWKRSGDGYEVVLDARASRFAPRVEVARMAVVDRRAPVYTYAREPRVDEWTVARGALGSGGARWLPVRHPALYAADVFRTLARSHGIVLSPAVELAALPEAEVLVEREGEELTVILKEMLRYSTNLTAEVVGLSATIARGLRPGSLAASAAEMNRWLAGRFGATKAAMTDHSGLGAESRMTAGDMVRALSAGGVPARLAPLLKPLPREDAALQVRAKTGTLNFVSALAGYGAPAEGSDLVFAILTSDLERRRALGDAAEMENPPGSRAWIARSRGLQAALIERWAGVHL